MKIVLWLLLTVVGAIVIGEVGRALGVPFLFRMPFLFLWGMWNGTQMAKEWR